MQCFQTEEEERADIDWRRRERLHERRKGGGEVEEVRREELSQYECKLCGDQHYHTKKKLQLLELPGYQFANPCPPSVRSVRVIKTLSIKFPASQFEIGSVMSWYPFSQIDSLWREGYSRQKKSNCKAEIIELQAFPNHVSLHQLKISDLSGVDIPWRFLTKVWKLFPLGIYCLMWRWGRPQSQRIGSSRDLFSSTDLLLTPRNRCLLAFPLADLLKRWSWLW